MFGINNDPVPPKPAIEAVHALLAAMTDPVMDAVYKLLAVATDPAETKRRLNDLQAKIDVIDNIAARSGQLDARERSIAERESVADERALALDAREQVVIDMKELADAADRRVEFATQAETKLAEKQQQHAAECKRNALALQERLIGLTGREEKIKALEADLAIRVKAMDAREKAYADWLRSGPISARG